jgi:hypothetical protein
MSDLCSCGKIFDEPKNINVADVSEGILLSSEWRFPPGRECLGLRTGTLRARRGRPRSGDLCSVDKVSLAMGLGSSDARDAVGARCDRLSATLAHKPKCVS